MTQLPKITLTYWITACLIFATHFFTNDTLDIAVHDTYFVIPSDHLLFALSILFIAFGLITLAIHKMSKPLSSALNWLHYGLTTICLALIFVLINMSTNRPVTYKDYSVYDEMDLHASELWMNEYLALIVLILLLSQSLFLIQILRAFVVKKKGL